jgi:RNA polymerase sigma-70 factor (ECF subfamily)
MAESWAGGPTTWHAVDALEPLLRRMRCGDERALEALYDSTAGKMLAVARAIVRDENDAEEVICTTYAYVWAHAARYEAGRASVLGWLTMLCRSRALDLRRQRRAQSAARTQTDLAELLDEGAGPDDLLGLVQEHSQVHAALSSLNAQRRRLVSMAFLHGLSHPEIAAATGLPLGTVKSEIRRALAQLRERLEAP